MCLGVICPITKDNEENKARWLGGGANLPLSVKKHFPWQPQLTKVGTTQERHLNYLLYAHGAAAATSYMGLPIKISPSRYFYLASHVHMGCFSKLHLLPWAAHLLPCQSMGTAWHRVAAQQTCFWQGLGLGSKELLSLPNLGISNEQVKNSA